MHKFAAAIIATACLAFNAQGQHKPPEHSSSPRFDGGPTYKHKLPPNGNPGHKHPGHGHKPPVGHGHGHTPPVGHGHGHTPPVGHGHGHHHHHVHRPEQFRWHGHHYWRYPGNYNRWSHHHFSHKYGCEVYWHPHHRCYYYWCAPHHCYYPVTYNPFGTYVFEEGVTYPEVAVPPVVTQVETVVPRCGCGVSCPCRRQGPVGPDPLLDPDGDE
jgi:hypothetical protein